MAGVPDAAGPYPGTVPYVGEVRTVDDAFGAAEGVAVRDGRFLAVGDTDESRDRAGADTGEVGLRGRTVAPGLVDTHVHLRQVGADLAVLDAKFLECPPDDLGGSAST